MLKKPILTMILICFVVTISPKFDMVSASVNRPQLKMDKKYEILLTWKREIWEATAYNESERDCGKSPSDPLYRITASGTTVHEHRTVATGSNIPFGTQIYIPSRSTQPNGGIYISEDRGDAIGVGHIDVYIPDDEECFEFGRKRIEIYVPRGIQN